MSARRLPPKNDVLGFMGQENRAFHAREVALELGVPQPSYQALVNLLDNLVLEGELTALPGGKYRLGRTKNGGKASAAAVARPDRAPASEARGGAKQEEREGTLTVNQRGFGFVSSLGASGDDVFVSKESMKGAMHGDRVVVHVRSRG